MLAVAFNDQVLLLLSVQVTDPPADGLADAVAVMVAFYAACT